MTTSALAGLIVTAYAVLVALVAAELARIWWGVQRAGRRCSPDARALARRAVALVVFLAGPVFLGLTPTLTALPVAGLLFVILRRVRTGGVVIRSTLSRPRRRSDPLAIPSRTPCE